MKSTPPRSLCKATIPPPASAPCKLWKVTTMPTDKLLSATIAELEALMAQATPGPWAVREGTYAVHQPEFECWIPADKNDAALIVATVNALPALIAAARERDRLEKECFALAADGCHAGYSDEYGNHRCREVDAAIARAEALEKERDELLRSEDRLISDRDSAEECINILYAAVI